jgi:hypothetical protein
MYVNGKMRPVKTVPGMGRGRDRRMVEGVNSSMIYLIYCKNFCKCQCTPTQHNNKKIKYVFAGT